MAGESEEHVVQAGESLRNNQEMFRLLVESVKDYAIFVLDIDGTVISWNAGAERIKGYRADEIIGRHFSTFYTPDAIASRWPWRELEIATRDGRLEDEGWRVRKDGSLFWANVTITALHDKDGALRGFAKVTRDLTDRRRIETLEEAAQRMNEFLATVSHELRTPLNSMLGWIRLIRSGRLDAETLERGIATIERNTLAQAQLIEDLLDVSRIISGKMRLAVEPVNLGLVLQAAVDSLRLAADAKDIRITLAVDATAGLVSGDPARLQQVVWNLLSNAIKFTPKGGSVLLELATVESNVEVRVIDSGRGIDPEFLPHVFDRFRQADASPTRAQGGLGLGLAIVKHLVEAHGGTVRIQSEGENRGTSVFVRLPVMAVRMEADVRSGRAESSPVGGLAGAPSLAGIRVLVVDDEADAREMLTVLLGECGAAVRSAGSAADALATLDAWVPDVLVSDIGMPGQDGHQLIRLIRERPAETGGGVPAVALTAYARLEDRMRALGAGFQMHVAKPVEPVELVMVIHSLLEFKGQVSLTGEPKPRL
jgi:PAS domain S-box-containing protein